MNNNVILAHSGNVRMETRYHYKINWITGLIKLIILLVFIFLPCTISFGQENRYAELIKEGHAFQRQGNDFAAAKIYREAMKNVPPSRYRNEGGYYLGEILFKHENYKEALQGFLAYEDAVSDDDQGRSYSDPRGRGCAMLPVGGAGSGTPCIKVESWNSLYTYIARCHQKLGDNQKALENFYKANGMNENGANIRGRDHWARATSLYYMGILLKETGRNDQAVRPFNEALRLKRGLSAEHENDARMHLAEIYSSTNNYSSLYYALNPISNKTAEQYNILAFAAFKINKFEDADDFYEKALSMQPSIDIDVTARQASKKNADEIREKERQRLAEIERQRQEAEKRRAEGIKMAEIGDKLIYSETWRWSEGAWIFQQSGTFTMAVTCFVERIEGTRYQLRVGDIQSSSSQRSNTVTINGVRVSKGDIIWARPLTDTNWIYGE